TIRVQEGATVTIDFKNDTDLPAALHSHGVRMENRFDGAPPVTQKETPPGGSFEYTLMFPDPGVFWYHPHVAEVYEQPLGLYGAFMVVPDDPGYYPPVNREELVFLSDIPIENGEIALTKDGNDHSLMGHYGNTLLVNGEERYLLQANEGEVVRFDFVNAANARPFNVAISGARMKLIGADNGAYEKASWVDGVTLSPSERAIVDVSFSEAGVYELLNKTPEKTYSLGAITVGSETAEPSYAAEFETLQTSAAALASIEPFRRYFGKAPDKRLTLTVDMTGMMGGMSGMQGAHMMSDGTMMGGMMMAKSPDGIEWEDDMAMMNAVSTTDNTAWHLVDETTGKKDMDIEWNVPKGTPTVVEIYNDPGSAHPMQHPIHFHGQRFLIVSRDGVSETNLAWKDTVLVKTGERVRVLLDASNPGAWMAHCHIAEHLAAGMMTVFTVQ
ncbi:MAG: multicopper oxidase family protein, partial [Patescibacteria group bacterium]